MQVVQRHVHGIPILLHDGFAAFAVSLFDGLFDGVNGLFAGQHAADGEEAGLHNRVDATAHACGSGDFDAVNDEKLDFLLDNMLLRCARQLVPDFLGPVNAVKQEGCLGLRALKHIEFFDKGELMARHEIRARDEVGALDGVRAETQMRRRHGA